MYSEKIEHMIMDARKSGDKDKTLVYQALKNEFLKFKTAKNAKPLDDSAEISILRKMVKERTDAEAMYREANRIDLADNEKMELDILSDLLPKGPSVEDIKKNIEEFISTVDVFDRKQMGACIKFVKSKLPTVDGKELSQLVQSYF